MEFKTLYEDFCKQIFKNDTKTLNLIYSYIYFFFPFLSEHLNFFAGKSHSLALLIC